MTDKTLTPVQGLLIFVGYMMFIYTLFGIMIAASNSLFFIIPQAICVLGGLLLIVWKVKV